MSAGGEDRRDNSRRQSTRALLSGVGEELAARALRLWQEGLPSGDRALERASVYAHARSVLNSYKAALEASELPYCLHGDADPDLAAAWTQLSDADREVLALISWEGLSQAEAAVVLEVVEEEVARQSSAAQDRLNLFLSQVQEAGGS